jgi:hypothetical protein
MAERDRSRLLEAKGVMAAELVPLERAGDLHPQSYDWMLVVDLANDSASQRPLDELFDDLLSANAHPIMLRCAEP